MPSHSYPEEEKIVNIKCPKCGCDTSKVVVMNGPKGTLEFGLCTNCEETTVDRWLELNHDFIPETPVPTTPVISCPYCHSTNTKKISSLSKAAGIAAFGVFALGRSTKQWHCNNCKSDF